MKILSIGTDRKLFEEGSAVRARQIEYAKKWEEIHIVVFSIKSEIKKIRIQISDNVWVYSTGSLSKLFYILDAIKIDEEKILASVVFSGNDLRKKYPQFDFIVLMAGRLEPEKNFSFALEIWREVVKKNLRAGLIIVGSGSISDVLKLQVTGYKLQDNVVFEPWTENLFSYYKTADIFLNTSFYEGYGMTLAEAAVADCPIVSSDVGIFYELFQSGKKVAICPVDDKNCFVAKIM